MSLASPHEKLDYIDNIQYEPQNDKLMFKNNDIMGFIQYDANKDEFIIKGTSDSHTIEYIAARPLWRNYSFDGSGLPFPNPAIAYENTPNHGIIKSRNGTFEIIVKHPSEYYVKQGTTLLKPHIHLHLLGKKKFFTIVIGDYLPSRSLKNLPFNPNRTIGR